MKKFIATMSNLLTLVLVLTLTGCGMHSKEELDSEYVSMENLNYFKQIFMEYEDFMYEDYAIRIDSHGDDFSITLYCLDATGKSICSYDVQGDIFEDILYSSTKEINELTRYTYDFETDGNTLIGKHHID